MQRRTTKGITHPSSSHAHEPSARTERSERVPVHRCHGPEGGHRTRYDRHDDRNAHYDLRSNLSGSITHRQLHINHTSQIQVARMHTNPEHVCKCSERVTGPNATVQSNEMVRTIESLRSSDYDRNPPFSFLTSKVKSEVSGTQESKFAQGAAVCEASLKFQLCHEMLPYLTRLSACLCLLRRRFNPQVQHRSYQLVRTL